MPELTEQMQKYQSFMADCIDDDGVSLAHGIIVDHEGAMLMLALAVPPEQAYQAMLMHIAKSAAQEAIWALDRFAKDGQGTKYKDLLAGQHFINDYDKPMQKCFHPFIIEYQIDPRIVEPVDYGNEFWNTALCGELARTCGGILIRTSRSVDAQ
jgi:hypothetical protein